MRRPMIGRGEPTEGARASTRCPRCGEFFAPDASFCAFDGEVLAPAETWAPADDAVLGSVIGARYEVEALIGEGGVGSVYRVRDTQLGRRFALKLLRPELANERDVRERFLREVRTARRLEHRGLARICDVGQLPDGRPFFVMELLEGLSLRALLAQGGLAKARSAVIGRGIAEALSALHEAGVVHRDLKPENVHVGSGDAVTLLDFGLALALDESQRSAPAGLAFGSPHYMSPEQSAGEAVDARSDVYALGVVLYEMLTGRVPFDAGTAGEILRQHQQVPPVPPSAWLLPGHDAADLERVVLRCLEKRPEQRYATLAEVARALAEVAGRG